MLLHRIKNPRTIYNGMNVAVTYDEGGTTETRWGLARQEKQCGAPGAGGELRPFVRFEWIEDNCDAPYRAVEDFTAEAESWIEIDLHDPVTALQILLRCRDTLGPGVMFHEEQDVLVDLLHDSPAAVARRTTALTILLARLDAVSEEKEGSDADPS